MEPTSFCISQTYSPESELLAKKSSSELEVLSLITERSALDKISFLFLNHLVVSGGVPENSTLNWTFEPGKTFMDSGFSRMQGGSVRENQIKVFESCTYGKDLFSCAAIL